MPHTSHKNKKRPQRHRNKRGELESEDGWTRIARSNSALTINPVAQMEMASIKVFPPGDPDYDPEQDEGYTQMTFHATPAKLPDDSSLEKALNHYDKCEAEWKQSTAWAELNRSFGSRVLKEDLDVTNAICFGPGSPTGLLQAGVVDRRTVSMYQIIVFRSVIDILTEKQHRRPEAYVQEPLLHTLDIDLLSHLDIKVVQHPEAFYLITPKTFAFCPCAEQFVVRGTLHRSPAMYLGSSALETYRDPETGQLRAPSMGSTYILKSEAMSALGEHDAALDNTDVSEEVMELRRQRDREMEEKRRAEQMEPPRRHYSVKGASILHHFKLGKESFRFPDFEHDYAIHDFYLFWRSSKAKAEEAS